MNNNHEFNSLQDVIDYFVRMNGNVLQILSAISNSITSDSETIEIKNVDASGVERNISIPSYSHFSKKLNEINRDVEKLYQIKNKELNNSIFSNYLIAEENKITDLVVPSEFFSKPNFILENLLNPLLYIKIDLTNKIDNSYNQIQVRRFILNLDTTDKEIYFNQNFNKVNNLDYDEIVNKLKENNFTYIIDDDIRNISPTILKRSGVYSIINIFNDIITNSKFNTVRKIKLDTLDYIDNINAVNKTLNIGDILITNDGNTEYEILDVDTNNLNVIIGRKSGFDELKIGRDVLKIATEPIGDKILEIPINYKDNQIIFTKLINSTLNTINSTWDKGIALKSSDLSINTESGLISFDEYYLSKVVDYGKVLNELAKQTNINQETTTSILKNIISSEISSDNNIKISPPNLNENSFKIVDLNEELVNRDVTKRATSALSEKSTKESEKAAIVTEITNLNNLINAETVKTSPNIDNIKKWTAERAEKELAKSNLIDDINNIITDMKNINSNIINVEPFPVIIGAVELPTIPDVSQPDELFVCYLEYRYRFLTDKKIAVNSYNLTLNNGTVTTSYWKHENGPKMHRTLLDNSYVYQQLDNLNPDVKSINEIELPLYNITPGYVEIQTRFCYQLTPITPISYTNWSESIFIDYSEFTKEYSQTVVNLLQKEIFTATILEKYNDIDNILSNLTDRIKTLENIKETNSYQYKDFIVLNEYNISQKTIDLTKTPQSENILIHLVGGQPIAPTEYNVYYKKVTWNQNSSMNSLIVGDTLIIEYLS